MCFNAVSTMITKTSPCAGRANTRTPPTHTFEHCSGFRRFVAKLIASAVVSCLCRRRRVQQRVFHVRVAMVSSS